MVGAYEWSQVMSDLAKALRAEPPCSNGNCTNTWWIDWTCVSNKLNKVNSRKAKDLEQRIAMLQAKMEES